MRALTLDQLAREQGLTRVDYLKMNIKGAEGLAIAGILAEEEGASDETRTLAAVRAFARANGFATAERRDDGRSWVRDQIYGTRLS